MWGFVRAPIDRYIADDVVVINVDYDDDDDDENVNRVNTIYNLHATVFVGICV